MTIRPIMQILFVLLSLFFISACTTSVPRSHQNLTYRTEAQDSLLGKHAPVFHIQSAEKSYNRIGGVKYSALSEKVSVDFDNPAIYSEERTFKGKSGQQYTNLIYRVHFSQTPFSLWPFHLTAGNNVGLFVIVTLNGNNEPLLYTSLHTCGCYLAFVPTSLMKKELLPNNWSRNKQDVYGEELPGIFTLPKGGREYPRLHVWVREATHRVMHLQLGEEQGIRGETVENVVLEPMRNLRFIETGDGVYTSFFEKSGSRQGYVKGSQKIWERLLMGWWALDGKVGEDKDLGYDIYDGPIFYTSLKPWARNASDLRDFSGFLEYWGFYF